MNGFSGKRLEAHVRQFSLPDNLFEHQHHTQFVMVTTGQRNDSSHEDYNKTNIPLYNPILKSGNSNTLKW